MFYSSHQFLFQLFLFSNLKYSKTWLKRTCSKADTWLRRTESLGPGCNKLLLKDLFKADTWLRRTIFSGPVGVRFSQVLLYGRLMAHGT